MILHSVAFTWNDDVSAADIDGVTDALLAMAAALPMLRFYSCGKNLRVRPSSADFAVVAVVDDEQALAAYLDSDEHAVVQRDWLGRMIKDRVAFQLPIDGFAPVE